MGSCSLIMGSTVLPMSFVVGDKSLRYKKAVTASILAVTAFLRLKLFAKYDIQESLDENLRVKPPGTMLQVI